MYLNLQLLLKPVPRLDGRAVGVAGAPALGGQRARDALPAHAPLDIRTEPARRRTLLSPA